MIKINYMQTAKAAFVFAICYWLSIFLFYHGAVVDFYVVLITAFIVFMNLDWNAVIYQQFIINL